MIVVIKYSWKEMLSYNQRIKIPYKCILGWNPLQVVYTTDCLSMISSTHYTVSIQTTTCTVAIVVQWTVSSTHYTVSIQTTTCTVAIVVPWTVSSKQYTVSTNYYLYCSRSSSMNSK